jgi:hypothetical protein
MQAETTFDGGETFQPPPEKTDQVQIQQQTKTDWRST